MNDFCKEWNKCTCGLETALNDHKQGEGERKNCIGCAYLGCDCNDKRDWNFCGYNGHNSDIEIDPYKKQKNCTLDKQQTEGDV